MTPEEREARLKEIREMYPKLQAPTLPAGDVLFLLTELDRVTAERDEAAREIRRLTPLAWRNNKAFVEWSRNEAGLLSEVTQARDAALARAEEARERDEKRREANRIGYLAGLEDAAKVADKYRRDCSCAGEIRALKTGGGT